MEATNTEEIQPQTVSVTSCPEGQLGQATAQTTEEKPDVEMQAQESSTNAQPAANQEEQKGENSTENVPEPANQVVVSSDLKQLNDMYQAQNMIKGIAPSVLTDEDIAAQAAKAQEKKPRNIYIPPNLFAEFTEVDLENEDFFKYIAYQVLIQFMDRVTDLDWIVHFPENIPSTGRSYIHDCATFFGLHSHSQGSKKRWKSALWSIPDISLRTKLSLKRKRKRRNWQS